MKVTVRQVAQAMIDDKTPKAQNIFFEELYMPHYNRLGQYQGSTLYLTGASCALGGAAVVLGVADHELIVALNKINRDGVPPYNSFNPSTRLGDTIINWNDHTQISKEDLGKKILKTADEKTLDTAFRVPIKKHVRFKRAVWLREQRNNGQGTV